MVDLAQPQSGGQLVAADPGPARRGFRFYVEGEFARALTPGRAPGDDRDWQPFGMFDLHPTGDDAITIWRDGRLPVEVARHEATEQARQVIAWMVGEIGWEGFDACLYLDRGEQPPEMVFRWEIC